MQPHSSHHNKTKADQQYPKGMGSPLQPKVEKTHILNLDDDDDDLHGSLEFSCILKQGTTMKNPISVEQYSEDRDLDIAIKASLKFHKDKNSIDPSQDYYYHYDVDEDDIKVLDFMPQVTPPRKRKSPAFSDSVTVKGQSSNHTIDPDFVCEICVEPVTSNDSFSIKGCTHAYCIDCMVKYVASKLQENITNICCPVSGCKGLLEPEYCLSILPREVFDRWGNALCEAVIPGSRKFYCPFKDCSAMLIDDGHELIRESECPNCRRLFCAQCKVPWHSMLGCEEFKQLHKDEREREDILLMNLAKHKNWRRCPKCRIFVERTEGCRYMRCRCGIHFCYSCGSTRIETATHYCPSCKA